MLKGKTVLIGVTGSIAAYKMADCARELTKMHADVHVLMTQNATQFINPITFETLTQHTCLIDTFDRSFQYSVEHVALAKAADIVLVAPASANVIGKIANGIADDMLTTTVMACPCKKLIAPAMNHNMFHNPIVQENIEKLRRHGYGIIDPINGMLANRDIGDGKLPDISVLLDCIIHEIAKPKDMSGMKVLCTAGATMEAIDPVRYITNHSTGKMGIALAKAASMRGADVTLVAGSCTEPMPPFVNVVRVKSAEEMFNAVTERAPECDIIVKAAAVADYTPETTADSKIKKSDGDMSIPLKRTKDIIGYLGSHRPEGRKQLLCGFSMETDDLIANSTAKLTKKGLDMVCANSLRTEGAGFGTDTNVITLITADGTTELEKMSKLDAADRIFDKLLGLYNK
ncbi:phosphopantothenoylcysteine decarboxylase / phosphopantothenate--cysteine ligase [Ruminococcus sp. YE71]|uniref:bifunctional phosphopantothenoylcysteine decarboxylase/phosphopantothenate--cysteine ligase CoaBC n=1 Tax=unclassified Ruminococcus TaxID=2608920 RepID=UPI00088EA172|nr:MULTISPECIES: bifunctional phosphopantothenoylcysteine decarboxylase/phosphopantothenate--cysteine ligase CoaBC [unclassified Ruminococcus]SDA13830.1 phosphopantothenoylcysteine decarboxylase / phosphopantothenate--cysteine ligase [Ruminococcus sp. YE78]SFW19900.1 phosphopantothenoylcysteine decarboxylase / phosphopantothenate--cysteine ligase [Ruminococcus sp. YE71]